MAQQTAVEWLVKLQYLYLNQRMNTLQLAKHKRNLLQEIGDASAGSFPFSSKATSIKTSVKKLIPRLQSYVEMNRKLWASPDFSKHVGYDFDPQSGRIKAGAKTSYLVTGESGIEYNIKITYDVINKPKDKSDYSSQARVDFNVKGKSSSSKITSTNANEQYKLISTVVAVFIDFANAIEPLTPLINIEIHPIAESSEKVDSILDSKRARLYKAYINKNLDKLPGEWTVEEESNSRSIIIKRK